VLQKGERLRVGPYTGKYLPGRTPVGVAVIVSKAVARTAVARNKLRRAAYRTLRTLTLPKNGALALFVRN